jgi:NAD(P)H-dependent FMN reductase
MTHILAINGSPRRDMGRSHQILTEILSGAAAAGAETEILHLIDETPEYCVHCGHSCFADGDCIQEVEATLRSRRVQGADALIVCAPVYCWQPSGLTVAFFDKLRLLTGSWNRGTEHGRPALGIAVAGGTGTGVFTALQSIYAWMCLWKFRPLDPLPITRFNMDRVLAEAASLGQALAGSAPHPFEGTWETLLTYDRLPYMDYGRVDEFRWLAEQIVGGLQARDKSGQIAEDQRLIDGGRTEATIDEIKRLLYEARVHASQGAKESEAQKCVLAYRLGAKIW